MWFRRIVLDYWYSSRVLVKNPHQVLRQSSRWLLYSSDADLHFRCKFWISDASMKLLLNLSSFMVLWEIDFWWFSNSEMLIYDFHLNSALFPPLFLVPLLSVTMLLFRLRYWQKRRWGVWGGRRTSSVPLGVPLGVCMAPKQLYFSPSCNINLPVSSVRAAGKGRREQRGGLASFSVIGFPIWGGKWSNRPKWASWERGISGSLFSIMC